VPLGQRGHVRTPHHCHLKARIIAAVKNTDTPMLTRVWQELEYRIDVCGVTRGALGLRLVCLGFTSCFLCQGFQPQW
jgi:hypothetical protein